MEILVSTIVVIVILIPVVILTLYLLWLTILSFITFWRNLLGFGKPDTFDNEPTWLEKYRERNNID